MMRAVLLTLGAAGIAVLLSCCSHSNPVAPDYSAFAVDSVYYKCGRWFPSPPDQSRGLFDVFLSFDYTEDPLETWRREGLPARQRDMIESAGGVIVHEFNLPMVRVLIEAVALPPMKTIARGVTDPEDYPVRLVFWFKSAITQEDRDHVISLGATDIREIPLYPSTIPRIMGAVLPDESVPALFSWDRVRFIETGESLICPAKPSRTGR